MDPMGDEQLDYGDDEYGAGQKLQFQGAGAISALAEDDLMGEDDEYDDLYNDVNVGEGFMQSLQQKSEPVVQFGDVGNGAEGMRAGPGSRVAEPAGSQEVTIPGVRAEGVTGKDPSVAGYSDLEQKKSGLLSGKNLEEGGGDYPDRGISLNQGSGGVLKIRVSDVSPQAQVGGGLGYRGPVVPSTRPPGLGTGVGVDPGQVSNKLVGAGSMSMLDPGSSGIRGAAPTPINRMGVNRPMVNETPTRPVGGPVENGNTMLFVGELHWWTTDAELESMLSQYGRVKELKFFDERASGKSKGYCQVEFYDASAAAACKEGMNGHAFNGRACVVAFASPQTLRQMGAAYMNKTQAQAQAQSQSQGRRPMNDVGGRGGGMNYQSGDGGRGYGGRGYGRGGQGMFNRGLGGGMARGKGAIGVKGMMGSSSGLGSGSGGGPYGQGLAGPPLGGPPGGLMHAMGAGFDPTYGAHMGRGGAYAGFSSPFPGMMPSFPAVNTVALPGVAPHVNPAFFGRGVSANGMGMMVSSGMDVHHAGMWTDASMGGWGGEEHGRTRESSYGDDVASDYGYGEASHERGGRTNVSREKDRGSEQDWSGNSERRHREERESDWDRSDRDRYRDDRDGYGDHRQRDRNWDNDDDWDRGRSSSRSRTSKSRMLQEEDHRSRSKDTEYGKRRRLPSE